MPKIFPFKAIRYKMSDQELERAVCPAYDAIGETLAAKLRKNSKNAIHIEVPEGTGDQKYRNARDLWIRWKKDGVVLQDADPAFYVYEQKFTVDGKKYSRRG